MCCSDSTTLVESYHPPAAIKVLKSYLGNRVKHVGKYSGAAEPSEKVEFYHDVRKRVDEYLKKAGLGYHFYETIGMGEVFLTLALYLVANYFKLFHGSILAALCVGVLSGRMGFLMHMGNHCGTSKFASFNRFTGLLMDFIGATHMTWLFEHQVAHHCYPNEFGSDNDCEIGAPLLRFHPSIKRAWWHRWNHLITLAGMPFGAMKWVFSDFVNLYTLRISNVEMNASKKDIATVLLFKSFFFTIHVFLPLYFWGWRTTLAMWFAIMVPAALYMEHIFIVNHIQDGLIPSPTLHWAARQVESTYNWCGGSQFWNVTSGGLNHQVEHHLFPAMSYYLYPIINPIVRKCCSDHGLTYRNFGSYPEAWISMVKYLRDLGTDRFDHYIK